MPSSPWAYLARIRPLTTSQQAMKVNPALSEALKGNMESSSLSLLGSGGDKKTEETTARAELQGPTGLVRICHQGPRKGSVRIPSCCTFPFDDRAVFPSQLLGEDTFRIIPSLSKLKYLESPEDCVAEGFLWFPFGALQSSESRCHKSLPYFSNYPCTPHGYECSWLELSEKWLVDITIPS